MNTIHMDTDMVLRLARDCSRQALIIADLAERVRSVAGALFTSWQGGNSQSYLTDLNSWVGRCRAHAQAMDVLAMRVEREVNEWISVDRQACGDWIGMRSGPLTIGSGPGQVGDDGAPKSVGLDWWSWTESTVGRIDSVLDLGQQLAAADTYTAMGRFLNAWVADSQHGGWITQMNGLGKVIRNGPVVDSDAYHLLFENKVVSSPWFERGMDAFSVGFGACREMRDGESPLKAVVTEGVELVINKAIYGVPVVGQVFLVWDGVLLVGNLVSAGMDVAGLDQQAQWLQNTIDVVDPGTYTEALADGIYDFVGAWFN